MREIKFSAWDIIKKLMAEVTALHPNCGEMDGMLVIRDETGDSVDTLFDNYIVMQYTGLKDKKGAEIYEGDILMFETNVKGVGKQKHYWKVFFSEKGQWCAQRGETVSRLFEKAANHKVAGNIYDHPSLLTNEK